MMILGEIILESRRNKIQISNICRYQVVYNLTKLLGLVAEPARPAEAEAGCLSGPAGLGGITSLLIIPAYMLRLRHQSKIFDSSLLYRFQFKLDLLIIRKCQVSQQ